MVLKSLHEANQTFSSINCIRFLGVNSPSKRCQKNALLSIAVDGSQEVNEGTNFFNVGLTEKIVAQQVGLESRTSFGCFCHQTFAKTQRHSGKNHAL